jgi:hypothetical protein
MRYGSPSTNTTTPSSRYEQTHTHLATEVETFVFPTRHIWLMLVCPVACGLWLPMHTRTDTHIPHTNIPCTLQWTVHYRYPMLLAEGIGMTVIMDDPTGQTPTNRHITSPTSLPLRHSHTSYPHLDLTSPPPPSTFPTRTSRRANPINRAIPPSPPSLIHLEVHQWG